MSLFLIILACLLTAVAVVGAFLPSWWAAPAAYAGLLLAGASGYIELTAPTYIFWLVAAVIVLVICLMLPKSIANASNGVGYIAGATLAGTLVGLCIGHAGLILGAVAGAVFGSIAWCRTPAGMAIGFPSRKAINYLCAKCFPAIVTMCLAGNVIAALATAAQ